MKQAEGLAEGDFVRMYTAHGVFLRRVVEIRIALYSTTCGRVFLYVLEDPQGHIEYATRQCIEKNTEEV